MRTEPESSPAEFLFWLLLAEFCVWRIGGTYFSALRDPFVAVGIHDLVGMVLVQFFFLPAAFAVYYFWCRASDEKADFDALTRTQYIGGLAAVGVVSLGFWAVVSAFMD